MMKDPINRTKKMEIAMVKFIKFGLIGFSNTALTFGTYAFLVFIFDINYIVANIFGYLLGMVNSYIWNKNWVFRVNGNQIRFFIKFAIVNIVMVSINSLSLFLLVNTLHIDKMLSLIFVIGGVTVINFYLIKKWTFSQKGFRVG